MTISSSTSIAIGQGNAATTSWDYGFLIPASGDELVSLIDTTVTPNTETVLNNTQYTISGLGDDAGGSVVYPLSGSPLAVGINIIIKRALPFVQLTDIVNQSGFYPAVLEAALDYLTMLAQANNDALSYCVAVPVGSGLDPDDYLTTIQDAQIAAAASQTAAAASAATAVTSAATATTQATASTASATAAAASSTSSGTYATLAGISQVAAAASAAAAAASALSVAGGQLGTSATSNAVATGSKTWTTQAGLAMQAGSFVVVADAVTPANYCHGQVTAYSGTTLTVNVLDIGGSGTKTSWTISLSGPQGTGASGSGTVNAGTANQMAYYASSTNAVSGNANVTVAAGALTLGQAGSVQGSLVLSGSTSGTTTLAAPVAGTGTMTLQTGTDTLIGKATIDTLTNKTYDTAGTGNVLKIAGQQISSVSGNTTKVATVTGAVTSGHRATWDANGNLQDGGSTTGITVVRTQIFAANGTYTPNANMVYGVVECIGGGGGGGGAKASVAGSGTASSGGGGGSGGYSRLLFTAADIGASKAVTVGAGGAGGAVTPTSGSAGGDTSLGTLCVGKGGSGGALAGIGGLNGAGGAGGVAGTGDVKFVGNAGGDGIGATTSGDPGCTGGFGAAGPMGGSPRQVSCLPSSTATGQGANAFGAGGGGGCGSGSSSGVTGGGGKVGTLIITEYCTA